MVLGKCHVLKSKLFNNQIDLFLIFIFLIFLESCKNSSSKNEKKIAPMLTGTGILGHTSTRLKNTIYIVGGVEKQITRNEILRFSNGEVIILGNLKKARYHHTENLLPNGKLLIAGGFGTDAGVNSLHEIEEVDLNTGITEVVGSFFVARAGHTSTLLPDGRILFAGGSNKEPLDTAEIYDPKKKKIIKLLTMLESRSHFSATLLPSGHVILIGGHGSNMKAIEKFNPYTDSFSRAGDLNYGRFIHKSILLNNNKILVTGGYDVKDSMSEVELYDIKTQKTKIVEPMRVDRDGHSLVKLNDGKVLVLGGADMGKVTDTTEVFDPSTNRFKSLNYLNYKVESHTADLLQSGKIIIYGGNAEVPWYFFNPENPRFRQLKNEL
jgi:hypothetical protein